MFLCFYIFTFFFFLISLVFHELAHGFLAYLFGDFEASHKKRLTLNPLAHLHPFYSGILPLLLLLSFGVPFGGARPVPIQPDNFTISSKKIGNFLVTLAGPMVHFFLTLILIFLCSIFKSQSIVSILVFNIKLQIFLFVFNLIPILPLDGGYLILLFLPKSWQRWMEQKIVPVGFPILFSLGLLIYLGGMDKKIIWILSCICNFLKDTVL